MKSSRSTPIPRLRNHLRINFQRLPHFDKEMSKNFEEGIHSTATNFRTDFYDGIEVFE